MSYRLTVPEKWDDNEWFRKLTPQGKVAFSYLTDRCDLAGFIKYDLDAFTLYMGLSKEDTVAAVKEVAHVYIEKGGWFWIRNYLKYQKNLPLNNANNAHKGILKRFLEHPEFAFDVNDEFTKKGFNPIFPTKTNQKEGANKGLISPIGNGNANGISKDISLKGGVGGQLQPWQRKIIIECQDLIETSRGDKAKCLEYINSEVKHEVHRNQILGALGWI